MTAADGLVVLAVALLAMAAMAGVLVWERAHARRREVRPYAATPLAASGDTATERSRA